jgi:nicotinate-nucleotide pyrophosphorylase (carboxylating)
MTFKMLDPDCEIEFWVRDGQECERGQVLMSMTGKAWIFSAGERPAVDYLQHLSGIATKTNGYVKLVEPYKARVTDTRKGISAIRYLQNYAVTLGGGLIHQSSLHNVIFVKDSHIKMAGGSLAETIRRLRSRIQPMFRIDVECETMERVQECLDLEIESVLLDNMSVEETRRAVDFIDGRMETEASGGITEETVVEFAKTGVDRIAIGNLKHSASVIDISLVIDTGDVEQLKPSAKQVMKHEKTGAPQTAS